MELHQGSQKKQGTERRQSGKQMRPAQQKEGNVARRPITLCAEVNQISKADSCFIKVTTVAR